MIFDARMIAAALALICVAVPRPAADAASGPVYSPRILSPHVADAHSMRTFADFHRWNDLDGDLRAYEIYKYLADVQTGLFHMNVVSEGLDQLGEFTHVRDPVKIINVYGYAYCGILGPTMAGICEGVSLGPSRMLTLPGWNHVATETYYNDRWHYLDIDVRAVFRRQDGTLASLQEARKDASLWRERGPLFFPNDPLESTREIYQRTRVEYYHGFHQNGHTMDFVLRPGESLTRWWHPQGGRWHHLPLYNEEDWLRHLIEAEPRGPKPNHRHFTVHNHGNGQFIYQPNLTDESLDFANGVLHQRNIVTSPEGLTLASEGEGEAVFAVQSPYIIVPLVGQLETIDDDREASIVEWDATGATFSLSLDNGLTWQPELAKGVRRKKTPDPFSQTCDLTGLVSGRYGYLLKVRLVGSPDEAVVRRLKITTWVQVAPASLPSLSKGINRMSYRTGDHYGQNTRVIELRSHASRPEELLKYLLTPPQDYDPARRTSKIIGELTAKLTAPPGTRIAWFTATGQFRTHFRAAASDNRNSIAYSINGTDDFQTIYRADVPTYTDHWHYNAAREVRLDRPAATLYVHYLGDPALNNFAVYAHCIDERRFNPSAVKVTHAWRENSQRVNKTVTLDRPGEYVVETSSEPTNESIRIAVPSSGR